MTAAAKITQADMERATKAVKAAGLAERAALQQVLADALHQPKEGGHG